MIELKELLKEMVARKASDLHLRAGRPAIARVDGALIPLPYHLLSADTIRISGSLMNEVQRRNFLDEHEVDLAVEFENLGRFRVNIFMQRGLVNLALRLVPMEIPTLEQLNLPKVIKDICENRRGLVLITGTTGCGKSNTLAGMIDYINTTRAENIITIEDPVEFVHPDKQSIVSQRELGFDTGSYLDALRTVVRQDPNVILLGELRDLETVGAAITAAQTGHLVLSTIHTVNAAQTINRIIDLFPPHQHDQIRILLADTLKAVVSQRLLRRSDGTGRLPAIEVLVVTPLIKKLIEENNLSEIFNQMTQGQYYGMQTFNQALISLIESGKVALPEALAASSNPEELMLSIHGVKSSADNAKDIIER
ncbi:MAG: PilT/PilU family type 4a pilus ATPase [Endomicrobiales bacterium]|jgi:twitching motility protein PilT